MSRTQTTRTQTTRLRRTAGIAVAGLLAAIVAAPTANAAPTIKAGANSVSVSEAHKVATGALRETVFSQSISRYGPANVAQTGSALGRSAQSYDLLSRISKIAEYTPTPEHPVYEPGVHPVVKTYPADGVWRWRPFQRLLGQDLVVFRASTTDDAFTVTVTIRTTEGDFGIDDVRFDYALDLSKLALERGNNLAFIGGMQSRLVLANMVDADGNRKDIDAGWMYFNCNESPLEALLSGPLSGGVETATAALDIWVLQYTDFQDNPPPTICTWT